MQPLTSVTGVAIPFLEDDVNTDQIAPVGGGARMSEDYAQTLFRSRRKLANGSDDKTFVFNTLRFRTGAILVTGQNFGCGSSRESAVWALQAIGIRCIVARSFADIYRENCLQNGVLPVILPPEDALRLENAVVAIDGSAPFTADLVTQTISGPDGLSLQFEISPADRLRLIEGLDDIGLTQKHASEILDWEARTLKTFPWLQNSGAPGQANQEVT